MCCNDTSYLNSYVYRSYVPCEHSAMNATSVLRQSGQTFMQLLIRWSASKLKLQQSIVADIHCEVCRVLVTSTVTVQGSMQVLHSRRRDSSTVKPADQECAAQQCTNIVGALPSGAVYCSHLALERSSTIASTSAGSNFLTGGQLTCNMLRVNSAGAKVRHCEGTAQAAFNCRLCSKIPVLLV
jgi:hypothetical protein